MFVRFCAPLIHVVEFRFDFAVCEEWIDYYLEIGVVLEWEPDLRNVMYPPVIYRYTRRPLLWVLGRWLFLFFCSQSRT